MSYWFINRTLCDVLEEMRKCNETRNYCGLISLIEEAQSMANRMEASLYEKKDLNNMHDEWVKLKKEIKILRKERDELKLEKSTDEN